MLNNNPTFGALRLAPVCFDEADDTGTASAEADGAAKATDDAKAAADKAKESGNDAAFAELRRQAKAAEKRAADLEAKLKERDDAEKVAQGKWQEIAEERERERDALKAEISKREQQSLVGGIAKRLQFADPEDAFRFLDEADMADEKLAERALKALAKDKPYLLAKGPTRTGREVTGGDDNDTDKDPAMAAGRDILAMLGRGDA